MSKGIMDLAIKWLGGNNTMFKRNYQDEEENEKKEPQSGSTDLSSNLTTKPGEYNSQWQTQINDTIDRILNREKFSFDLNGDALYQQYKDNAYRQGKLAMNDAIGQASAMTGGYGNSYAQSVGQQQFQNELHKVNDVVPELYQMALDRYNAEGTDLLNAYGILTDRETTDYGKYRDAVGDWQTDRNYDRGVFESDRDYDRDLVESDRDYQSSERERAKNDVYQAISTGIMPSEEMIRAAGLDPETVRAMVTMTNTQINGGTTEGGQSWQVDENGYRYNNGSLTTEQILELQNALGAGKTDGKYGTEDMEMTGGLSAESAYDKYVNNALDYDTILSDLNTYVANGASEDEIRSYIKEAYKMGVITDTEYARLKEIFAPDKHLGGGRYTY